MRMEWPLLLNAAVEGDDVAKQICEGIVGEDCNCKQTMNSCTRLFHR